MKTALFISIVVLLLVGGCILADAASAACPPEPAMLIATGNELSVCTDEAGMTALDIKINGVVKPRVPLTMTVGVPVRLTGLVGCAIGTVQVAGVNAAGVGPWGAAVPTTFPPCTTLRLGQPLP